MDEESNNMVESNTRSITPSAMTPVPDELLDNGTNNEVNNEATKVKENVENESKEMDYPLSDKWILKYRDTINYKKGQTTVSWLDSFQLIYKISDVQTFWQVYNNMPWEPTIYSLFKEGINPLWEDPANKNGFSIHYYGEDDAFMVNTMIAILGATIPEYKSVNGFMFDTKRKKYSIWFSCPKSDNLVEEINKFLKTDEVPKVEDHQTVEVGQVS